MRSWTVLRLGSAALVAIAFAGAPAATHAVQSNSADDLWLAPASLGAHPPALGEAAANLAAGKTSLAEPVFVAATRDPILGGYALLYLGRLQLAKGRPADAEFSAQQLSQVSPTGALGEAALWLAADAAEALRDWPAEIRALQTLTGGASATPEQAWLRLGRTEASAGDRQAALQAFAKVYYEYALTDQASDAADEAAKLRSPFAPTQESYALDLGRAEQLFGAKRYSEALKSFEVLRPLAKGDDHLLVALRIAECDVGLKRYTTGRDALRAYLDQTSLRAPEAQFYYLSTVRGLGRHDEYVSLARAFVSANAGSPLTEEALNDLGTYFIREDDDANAAAVFGELFHANRAGPHADRAAWKAGWWAYRNGDFNGAIAIFEEANASLRRSDYRPSWLYWTARARSALGQRDAALDTYRVVVADYRNSYYGREAARAIERLQTVAGPAGVAPVSPPRRELPPTISGGPLPPNAPLIRALLAAGLYDDALAELRRVQREQGTSPLIEATLAYALNRRGDLRPAITAMRHAYPQFIAEGGEALPASILTVIFPVDYWSQIYKYAAARSLDPYLIAALVAQESTFDASAKSGADAWGLMQVLPSTGRQYAQRLGIRPFRTARLTDPDTNLQIGVAYFADLMRQYGDVVPALAAYNAGEERASRWLAERPGLGRDEFIDDLPFPETQNYIKRIIGQAEDYRLLYRRPGSDTAPHRPGGAGQEP